MQIASMPRPFDRGWRVGSKESKQASPKIVWLVKVVSPSPACVCGSSIQLYMTDRQTSIRNAMCAPFKRT
jgi:hypothetical protein